MSELAKSAGVSWRGATAVLTAWCAFWGVVTAAMCLVYYAALLGVEIEQPGETAERIFLGVQMALGGFVALLTVRWQWTRMRYAPSGDHRRLAAVLIVIGIALSPQPFVYATW